MFGISELVGLKPAIKTSWGLEILDLETRGIMLSKERIMQITNFVVRICKTKQVSS